MSAGSRVADADSRISRVAEKEDRLFEAWASGRESFVRDGVVDAEQYARFIEMLPCLNPSPRNKKLRSEV